MKWEEDQAARQAGKQQTAPGQVHTQLSSKEIGRQQAHQFQGKEMFITEYTKQFNALLDVAKQAGVATGWYEATAKISYKADGKDLAGWETLKNSADADDKMAVKSTARRGRGSSLRPCILTASITSRILMLKRTCTTSGWCRDATPCPRGSIT